jgi:hypothetical protein
LLKTAAARAARHRHRRNGPQRRRWLYLAFGAISPLTLNPHIMKVGYDPLRDIAPVASVMYAPVYVLATTAFKGNDFAACWTPPKPPQGRERTSGYGTLAHIMVEQLRRKSRQPGACALQGRLPADHRCHAGAQFDLRWPTPTPPSTP